VACDIGQSIGASPSFSREDAPADWAQDRHVAPRPGPAPCGLNRPDPDGAYRLDLKDEQGPAEVVDYLRVYAAGLAEFDSSGQVSAATARRVRAARSDAQRRLRQGGME